MACILITGGAGYVGSHCAKALAAKGHDGIVFDNLTLGHREFIRWGRLIEGDIRDAAALDAVFSTQQIDAVMHFAALAYVGELVTVPGRYYDVNVHGTFGISQITLEFDPTATSTPPRRTCKPRSTPPGRRCRETRRTRRSTRRSIPPMRRW